jgi:hypothetical protein
VDPATLNEGCHILNVKIETTCPSIGVYPVDADQRMLAGELVYGNATGSQTISAFLPRRTSQVHLRNATNSTAPGLSRLINVAYSKFEQLEEPMFKGFRKLVEESKKVIFIHSFGKSGTVSMLETLSQLRGVVCIRDHFINYPLMDTDSNKVEYKLLLQSLTLRSLSAARSAMQLVQLALPQPQKLDVICGLRHSAACRVATEFQNRGASFVAARMSPDSVVEAIYSTSAYAELLHFWWETEFFATHGFSLDQLSEGLRPCSGGWRYVSPSGVRFFFYRIEDGDAAIRGIASNYAAYCEQPESYPLRVARANMGADKEYSKLYKEVLSRIELNKLNVFRSPLVRQIDRLFYSDSRFERGYK